MSELKERIVETIRRMGPIPFERFMAMALYEPDLGYYMRPETGMGQAADFYTSTNVHALFGTMLCRQAVQMWELLDRPACFTVVEPGPGRGLFALDFLDAARRKHPSFYAALRYLLVERNPTLARRQSALLREHAGRLAWRNDLAGLRNLTGLLFSNELIDSFPVHLIESTGDGLRELYVTTDPEGKLRFQTGELTRPEIGNFFEERGLRLAPGYRTELNLNAAQWIAEAARIFDRGWIVTVDYGFAAADYYSPERSTGTLLCYHRHRTNEDPLERPGEQDITAHVNFTALVEWGRQAGLDPLGFTSQSSWLLNLGIDRELEALFGALPEKEYLETAARVRTLLMPDAMGESHKVLVQGRRVPKTPLEGLARRNVIHRLLT